MGFYRSNFFKDAIKSGIKSADIGIDVKNHIRNSFRIRMLN